MLDRQFQGAAVNPVRLAMNAPWQTIGLQVLRIAAMACLFLLSTACPAAEQPAPVTKTKAAATGQAEKRIEQLIAQLGDKDYNVRQRAQDELAKLGFLAFDALNAASNHEDFEIASRARYLLRLIRTQWTTDKDPPETRKLLEGYELIIQVQPGGSVIVRALS